MNKLTTFITVSIILLARIGITLTFLHFVYKVSPPHALALIVLYFAMILNERHLVSLMKEEK